MAEVDIVDPVCVVFSSLDEREDDTGDDELPVKQVQDGQACQSSSFRGLEAATKGSRRARPDAVRKTPEPTTA